MSHDGFALIGWLGVSHPKTFLSILAMKALMFERLKGINANQRAPRPRRVSKAFCVDERIACHSRTPVGTRDHLDFAMRNAYPKPPLCITLPGTCLLNRHRVHSHSKFMCVFSLLNDEGNFLAFRLAGSPIRIIHLGLRLREIPNAFAPLAYLDDARLRAGHGAPVDLPCMFFGTDEVNLHHKPVKVAFGVRRRGALRQWSCFGTGRGLGRSGLRLLGLAGNNMLLARRSGLTGYGPGKVGMGRSLHDHRADELLDSGVGTYRFRQAGLSLLRRDR